jgi:HD-GYP domain-containing protein (c-di-GMP phosphodiesterase class II)
MPTSPDKRYDNLAHEALEQSAHYLNSIAAMTERGEVVAGDDIYASSGMKLAAKGSLIDEPTRQKLLRHRLLKPAGLDLASTRSVTPEALAQQMAHLIDSDATLRQLADRSGDPLAMRHRLSRLELPSQLAFMLTVAQEQRPDLFRHLLTVTLLAHYLALGRQLTERETTQVLLAALSHDIGELHTDPVLLDVHHMVTDEERRFIYVHPITGYLIAQEIFRNDPVIAAAVLQHQERLDGSGYPYGSRGEKITAFARIIGVADVCASIFGRFGSSERLSALMRLNRQKFDIALLTLLQDGIGHPASAAAAIAAAPHARLIAAARLLEQWAAFRIALTSGGSSSAELAFLTERMASLRTMLLQFGFDPDSMQLLLEVLAEDPQLAGELVAALDEVHWQFADLAREIERRRELLDPTLSSNEKYLLDGWTAQLQAYLAEAGG